MPVLAPLDFAVVSRRASFITALRSSDAADDVLKSAAASMKHLVSISPQAHALPRLMVAFWRCTQIDTQSSDVYDRGKMRTLPNLVPSLLF